MEYRGYEIIGKVVEYFTIFKFGISGDYVIDDSISDQIIQYVITDGEYRLVNSEVEL